MKLNSLIALLIFWFCSPLALAQTPLSAQQANAMVQAGELVLIDLRTPRELAETGTPMGSVWIPIQATDFGAQLTQALDGDLTKPVAFICAVGGRSGFVTQQLTVAGLPNIFDVREGMNGGHGGIGWLAEGLPVERSPVQTN